MYQINRRREIIKNTVYIFFIMLLAIIPTYYIYNKFQGDRNIDFNSESLDVTYHEKSGNKLSLTKITPVTDSVGLSSKTYLISIKNNLTEDVDYKLKVLDDIEKIKEDECQDITIPKDDIRISIKTNKKATKIYSLNELENDVLLTDTINALEKKDISIRVWIRQDSSLPRGSKMHYHGIMQIEEEDR
ncbi:MAG: hypothetical protein IJ097_04000 [Bacilli bacterium]|nr:hypothetical protein [Bacilli bacterium]